MKLYLAAPYGEMKRMNVVRVRFEQQGHIITAQWLKGIEEDQSRPSAAQMDLDDIDRADAVVCYTLPLGTKFSAGGRHTEFGYAIAQKKLLFVIGDRENIFYHLPQVQVFDTTTDLLEYLRKEHAS